MSDFLLRRSVLAFTVAIGLGGGGALSQQGAPNVRAGLDALNDDAVMTELANRGLDQLLNRVFEQNNVPQQEREGRLTLIALRRLSDPESRLTNAEKTKLVGEVVSGIEAALPTLRDPRLLLQQANVLITQSVEPDVNVLEFFGENPRLQATVRPIADTVHKILARAIEVGNAEMNKAADEIKQSGDAASKRYEQMELFVLGAEFTQSVSEYYRVLARDRASNERKALATAAIEALREHDTPESSVQPVVKNRVGKLFLARGSEGDYAAARQEFTAVAEKKTEPKPDVAQQYEALYFATVANIMAGRFDEAQKGLTNLRAWQGTNIPEANTAWRASTDATAIMLEYRLTAARAEAAVDDQKQKLNDQAIALLVGLVRQHPTFRGQVYQQLLDRLPENPEVAKLDGLLLRAIMRQGEQEAIKPAGEAKDAKILARAVAATGEFVKRGTAGTNDISSDELAMAMLLRGILLQQMDQPLEATEAYLAFVEKFKGHANASFAMDNSMALIGPKSTRKALHENAELSDLYTRLLTAAVAPPFDRLDLAFAYGRQLQEKGRYQDAAEAYAKVPDNAPNKLHARYGQMIALKQHLDKNREKMPDAEKKAMLEQVLTLAGQFGPAAEARLAVAVDQDKLGIQQLLVQTTLMSADLAQREQGQPQRALDILKTFEQQVAGMSNEADLLASALFTRVNAYTDLKQNQQAANTLIELLNQQGGGSGAMMVYRTLERLNEDLDAARRRRDDRETMHSLASMRADLTGHLVKWAEQARPEFVYQYRVFDADSQRQAALLAPSDEERTRLLKVAQDRYKALAQPEGHKQYQLSSQRRVEEATKAREAAVAAGKKDGLPEIPSIDLNSPDPLVMLGMAQVAYDLGQYTEAQPLYTQLIRDRKLGMPRVYRDRGGERELVDNDQYWEAMYKLLRANLMMAQGDPRYKSLEAEAKRSLAQQYIMLGSAVGGQNWKDEFEKLRQELQIPAPEAPNAPEAPTASPAASAGQR